MLGRFAGKDIVEKPTCPFCGASIERPGELESRRPAEMPVGTCSCGAVYACDVTGHNLGSAMIEALVLGCDGDWDLAWDLLPEDDYLEKQVKNYDYETHKIIAGGAYDGRGVSGVLYFIRLHQDIREVTEGGVREKIEHVRAPSARSISQTKGKKSFTKQEVAALVDDYRIDSLLRIAEQDPRIIRDLKRLLYSADILLRRRAADALGKVSALIAREEPGTVSRLLQGLFTSLSDTAASSWGSLEAIGEIISNRPGQFAGFIPQLYHYLKDRALLADVLWALGKISHVKPDLIRKASLQFIPLLQDVDPAIRGYATILLGNLGTQEAKNGLVKLLDDSSELETYSDGRMERWTVGQLASQALKKI